MLDAGAVCTLEEIGQMAGVISDRVGQVFDLLQFVPDIMTWRTRPRARRRRSRMRSYCGSRCWRT